MLKTGRADESGAFRTGREDLQASLEGNYRPPFVIMLRMKVEEYDFFVAQMKNYEVCMEKLLKRIEASSSYWRKYRGR